MAKSRGCTRSWAAAALCAVVTLCACGPDHLDLDLWGSGEAGNCGVKLENCANYRCDLFSAGGSYGFCPRCCSGGASGAAGGAG
jgi:hypothetical protein